MSEFASLLSSFKQNAAAASTKQPSQSQSDDNTQRLPTRKRPHPSPSNTAVRSAPSFPSMHTHARRNKEFNLSFLVIGAQKAGTSWLHAQLQKCNRIALPEQKETHFWDWHYRKGIDWYIRQFSTRKADPSSNSPLYGEVTPDYIVLPPSTIAEIHKCYPDLKIIFVARDLVDRAWSAMIMELRDQQAGLQPGEWKRAKKQSEVSISQQRRLHQQSSPSSQPDSYYIERLRSETHTSRSDYATYLRNWYAEFPSDHILVLDFRDIEKNPRDTLLKVVMHIGLDEKVAKSYVEKLSDEEMKQRVNAANSDNNGINSQTQQKPTAATPHHSLVQRPRLRKQMEGYLRPYATKFNTLLSEKGYSWKIKE